MKRLVLCMLIAAALSGVSAQGTKEESQVKELSVFAAASMTETLIEVSKAYAEVAPDVHISFNFDSSGTLKKQIESGAVCDLFISAAQKQMNGLQDEDMIDPSTRIDLLENKVTLVVPDGNPKGITSFDQLSSLLKDGQVLLAMGNSDVPVGQYTQKIFAYYGIDEANTASEGKLTYGSNVKEVTTQVKEATVDCGIIYATDAASAGLEVVDMATGGMCGQVIYPAAVLKGAPEADAAKAFLDYIHTDASARSVFEKVGFTPL